jgi:hypothetical protein
MFNAIFGGIFSKQSESTVDQNDSKIKTGDTLLAEPGSSVESSEAFTQTNSSKNSKLISGPGPAKVKRSYSAVVASNLKKFQKKDDWVIVDRNEGKSQKQQQQSKINFIQKIFFFNLK